MNFFREGGSSIGQLINQLRENKDEDYALSSRGKTSRKSSHDQIDMALGGSSSVSSSMIHSNPETATVELIQANGDFIIFSVLVPVWIY